MPEEKTEAKAAIEEKAPETQVQTEDKQAEAEKSVDEKMDAVLDEAEAKAKASESSSDSEKKLEEKEPEKAAKGDEDPDLAKKGTEAVKEPEIPKEFHDHEAWKRNAQIAKDAIARAEAAEKKAGELEKSGVLSEEDRSVLDNVKQFTSSREFLEDKLKKEGFKEDVIKEKLAEAGFDVANQEGSFEVAAKALNLDPENLSDQDRSDISNLVKISNALIENTLGRVMPKLLNPISEQVSGLTSKERGIKIHDDFVDQVKKDNLLDFEKDLSPDIEKWLDDNEKPTFEDLEKFMQDTYREKLVLYKKAAEKKGEREEKAEGNRPGGEGTKTQTGLPGKTGDFNKDADALFDHMGIT